MWRNREYHGLWGTFVQKNAFMACIDKHGMSWWHAQIRLSFSPNGKGNRSRRHVAAAFLNPGWTFMRRSVWTNIIPCAVMLVAARVSAALAFQTSIVGLLLMASMKTMCMLLFWDGLCPIWLDPQFQGSSIQFGFMHTIHDLSISLSWKLLRGLWMTRLECDHSSCLWFTWQWAFFMAWPFSLWINSACEALHFQLSAWGVPPLHSWDQGLHLRACQHGSSSGTFEYHASIR